MEKYQFIECDTCRAKAGSPELCYGCLKNRLTIQKMKRELLEDFLYEILNKPWYESDDTIHPKGKVNREWIEKVARDMGLTIE